MTWKHKIGVMAALLLALTEVMIIAARILLPQGAAWQLALLIGGGYLAVGLLLWFFLPPRPGRR